MLTKGQEPESARRDGALLATGELAEECVACTQTGGKKGVKITKHWLLQGNCLCARFSPVVKGSLAAMTYAIHQRACTGAVTMEQLISWEVVLVPRLVVLQLRYWFGFSSQICYILPQSQGVTALLCASVPHLLIFLASCPMPACLVLQMPWGQWLGAPGRSSNRKTV